MSKGKKQTAYEQLTPRRQRFVDEYVIDFNGTQAAKRAGYSPRSANEQAAFMLAIPSVKAAVEERRKSIKKRGVDYRQYLIKKSKKLINKCTGDERWNPAGANGAIRNMVDMLGLRTEKREISGTVEVTVRHDLSRLTQNELKQLLALVAKISIEDNEK